MLAAGGARPSIVVIFLPATADTAVAHARMGLPSMCTVHAPHRPIPHEYFVPVSLQRIAQHPEEGRLRDRR